MTGSSDNAATGSVFEVIVSRSSTKKFADTPLGRNQIEALLTAAVRAPDHGLLAPWRFTILEGNSRRILGDAMSAALLEKMPDADAEARQREASKAFRSPVLIVVSALPQSHPKVPAVEQLVAVGAAIQNLWIAAHSMGLGAAWKTGSHAYSSTVKRALSLMEDEQILGFVHVGVPLSKAVVRPADLSGKVRWLQDLRQ
ncbi:MAG: hypothetical protein RLZZ372_1884 [Pseudomonadota bacterium]